MTIEQAQAALTRASDRVIAVADGSGGHEVDMRLLLLDTGVPAGWAGEVMIGATDASMGILLREAEGDTLDVDAGEIGVRLLDMAMSMFTAGVYVGREAAETDE